ncbi:hypothetical protein RNJ44_00159 [Nakaseomyces bracarensis]|uniref:Uncharacterized protein n=1 Tax=Nakaseomyces bracarensis TaxID=273131 RepID=A0ABR4NT35_9SACH
MLAAPVVLKQRGVAEHVDAEEVLGFLDRFVSNRDVPVTDTSIATTTTTTATASTNTGLALLRRVQRDFKGLPPQE